MDAETLYMILAIGLSVIGAVLSAVGYVMQKKGHNCVIDDNEIHEIADEDTSSFWSNRIWVSGFFVYVLGSLFTAAALKFGAQSVLAPLGALVLVCNAVLATKFLGEPFVRSNVYGIILVIIGSIMAVVFGPKGNSDPVSLDYIAQCWRSVAFLVFFLCLTLLLFLDYLVTKCVERKNYEAMDNHKITHGGNFLMISYIAIAAFFGSVNVLFMKSAVIIIGSFQISYFAHYLFYVTVVGIVAVNLMLENFRQKALVYFDAIYVVPIYQVLLILGSALMGAIFFDEFSLLSTLDLILFCASIVLTLIGVAILAYDVGSAYKKMVKKWNAKTPDAMHWAKDRNESYRSKAKLTKRQIGQKTLSELDNSIPVPSAFGGLGAHLAAQHFMISQRFMFNKCLHEIEAQQTTQNNSNGKIETEETNVDLEQNKVKKSIENEDVLLKGLRKKQNEIEENSNDGHAGEWHA